MKLLVLFAVSTILFLCRCTTLQPLGGTTDTGNVRVSALMYQSDGTFAKGALVRLRSANYLSSINVDTTVNNDETRETITDENGQFQFDSLNAGSYCIEINDGKSAASLFRITIGSADGYNSDSILSDTLKPYAKVSGNIDIIDSVVYPYCLVLGLERKAIIDPSGDFVLNDLPAGTYSFKIVSGNDAFKPVLINGITALSGSEIKLPFVNWNFSKKLILNTTASGAAIASQVTGFPVLIRLNTVNFNFDSSAADGSDIRFTNSNGDALYHEIERWDYNAKAAEIWVKVDTIHENDSAQYIRMFWGNSAVSDISKSSNVFDTADGFQGVWHFSNILDTMSDATPNSFTGSVTAVYGVAGLIGSSGEFDGSTSYITMPGTADGKLNFAENDNYSISAWVYSYDLSSEHFIAGKGEYQYNLKIKDQQWCFTQYSSPPANAWQSMSTPSETVSWRFLTGVRKGNSQYLYVNGVCVDSTGKLMSGGDSTRNTGCDFEIGIKTDSSSIFKTYYGKMDEVRISNVSRSPDWIKLSYMNQNETDKLVQFK